MQEQRSHVHHLRKQSEDCFFVFRLREVEPLRGINRFPRALHLHLPVFPQTKAMEYAVGMKMTFGDYLRCGERGYTLDRWVSSRFGVSEKDDALPKRLTDVPQDPANPKTKVPLAAMKKTYYRARGWDRHGVPTKRTLKRLQIIP